MVGIIVIAGTIVGLYFLLSGDEGIEEKAITMSCDEIEDDMELEEKEDYKGYDYYFSMDYKSLEPGDTLHLKDEITDIDYYGGVTEIYLDDDDDFRFEGDLTDEFDEGDIVIITLHVISIEYDESMGGSTFHIEGESFEEMWDSARNEPSEYPLSSSIIKHA